MYINNFVGIASLLSAFIAMLIAIYSSRKSKVPREFSIFLFFIVIWSLANAFSHFSSTKEIKLFWSNLEFSSLSFFVYFWFCFICSYSDSLGIRQQKVLNRLISIPIAISLGIWTNPIHKLLWTSTSWNNGQLSPLQFDYGFGYWFLFLPYFYVAILSSLFMLSNLFFNSNREYRRQSALLIIATLLPVMSSSIYFNSIARGYELVDYTPVAILGSSLIVAFLIFKDKHFKYLPIMAHSYFKSTANAVFMLNTNAVIMDYNLGAQRLIDELQLDVKRVKTTNLFDLFPELLTTIDSFVDEEVCIFDIAVFDKFIDISIVPVKTRSEKTIGYAVSIRDVSKQHKDLRRITKLSEFRKSILDLHTKMNDQKVRGNLFHDILEEAVNIITDAEAGSVIILGSDGLYHYKAAVGYDLKQLSKLSFKYDELVVSKQRYSKEVLVTRDLYSFNSEKFADDSRLEILQKCSADVKATLSIPIYLKNKLVAIIYLDSKSNPYAFDQEVEEMAEIFGNHIADTIQRSQLQSEIEGLSVLSKAMISLNSQLLNQGSFNNYYELLLARAEDVLKLAVETIPNASLGSFLLKENDERYHFKAVYGLDLEKLKNLYIEYDELFFTKLEPGQAIYSYQGIQNKSTEIMRSGRFKALCQVENICDIKSSLAIPIYIDNELLAIFNLDNTESTNAFGEEAKEIAGAFGNHISDLMYKAKLQKEIDILGIFKESMIELSTKLLGKQSLREFYQLLLTKIIDVMPEVDFATILEKKNGSEFQAVASFGYGLDKLGKSLIASSSFPKELTTYGVNSLVSSNFRLDIGKRTQQLTSLLVPIRIESELNALLVLSNKNHNKLFDAQGRQFAEIFASQIAAMLKRRQVELALKNGELFDQLTGLVNKQPFLDRVNHYLNSSYRKKADFAVLFLDIDRYENISSRYGHSAADQLLKYVAKRLEHTLKPSDTIARWGGSSFAVLLERLETKEEVIATAHKIRQTLAKSFLIHDIEILITVSLGIVYDNGSYQYPEEILQNAEITLNKAKTSGLGYMVFNSTMSKQLLERLQLESDLREAVTNGEFALVYQPILNMENSQLVGLEALIRWKRKDHGLVSPAEFIPLIEEMGLITSLDKWVMKNAIRQLKLWIDNPYLNSDVSLSINLSASSFLDAAYMDEINKTLSNDYELRKHVKLEITEHTLMEDIDNVKDILAQFRAQGVKILIDDFGTGYSSLSYLHELPIDILKIDRSFIENLPNDHSEFMVKTIVSLAHNLGLKIIAEGVETREQANYLRSANCEYAQGYFFDKPLSSNEIEKKYLSKLPQPA